MGFFGGNSPKARIRKKIREIINAINTLSGVNKNQKNKIEKLVSELNDIVDEI